MKRPSFYRLLIVAVANFVLPVSGFAQTLHTAHDHIPDFSANFTIRSVSNGPWSSAATWLPARVPAATDVVRIAHTVNYDSLTGQAAVVGVAAGGVFRFATAQSTRLKVGTLLVLPSGTLEIGTPATPVAPTVVAEIIITDTSLNLATDPDQFGTGLISVDGTVTMHGADRTPTFIRVAVEPRAGHGTVTLERAASGWRVGDRVFLPDTRQTPPNDWFNPNFVVRVEERAIQSISTDGRTITLASPLTYDHRGARDADGTPTLLPNSIRLLPHVGNLTRNVVIRSANPAGTRGHTVYTSRSTVSISHVQFQDLGRTRAIALNAVTNHIGRYPIHIHHLWGPINPTNTGYQFTLLGNAVADSLKWPIAVHGSHFGLIKQNVVFGGSQLTGAGMVLEDGTETENLFEENFVANIRGNVNARQSGPGTADGLTPGSAAECYWLVGFNNRFVNNVAASCRNPTQEIVAGPGWKFILVPAPYQAQNPRFRGADMTQSSQTVTVTPEFQPIREFSGNEVYGLAADGLTAWQLGTDGFSAMPATMPESVIKDLRVWHTYEGAVWNYPANRMTIEGLVYRVDPAATVKWPPAVTSGDYRHVNLTIRGGSIHAGAVVGGMTDPLGVFVIENVDAVTREHAFSFATPATPGTAAKRPLSGVTMVLKNNTIQAWPGQPQRTVRTNHTLQYVNSDTKGRYDVFVYDYQGQAGNNFRVYFPEQATQNLYGGLAPCNDTTTRPEIQGITCPMTGTPPPQPNPRVSAPTGVRVIK